MTKNVKLFSLKSENLGDIIDLYHIAVGGSLGKHSPAETHLKNLLLTLNLKSSCRFRFGSRLSPHSKLQVRIADNSPPLDPLVNFRFDANVDKDAKTSEKAKYFSDAFDEFVNKYLEIHGLTK